MAKLGDAFSEEDRRKAVARRLVPGAVIYLDIVFPEGPRSKFLVIAQVDADCCTLIVNSEINPFVAKHPDLYACQVLIDAPRHPFLKRDSYIACEKVLRLPTQEVVGEILKDMGRLRGTIHAEVRAQICAALKRAPTLSPAEQTRLVAALESTDR